MPTIHRVPREYQGRLRISRGRRSGSRGSSRLRRASAVDSSCSNRVPQLGDPVAPPGGNHHGLTLRSTARRISRLKGILCFHSFKLRFEAQLSVPP